MPGRSRVKGESNKFKTGVFSFLCNPQQVSIRCMKIKTVQHSPVLQCKAWKQHDHQKIYLGEWNCKFPKDYSTNMEFGARSMQNSTFLPQICAPDNSTNYIYKAMVM